ncbi:WD40-repeat-containing domain protein [Halteromyces radiatus]|uniref:WD40-repeat-containing domain protein n=1 Tax=Halteromyces radiatus TaxID=101107 RepID=UPI00221EDE4B|nr:WD40-repeat-containing domain protein [Halteromyces radiatus]KAI8096601.1 WD40-repeat-containing domain protein [Halteromyces radiatus]
MSDFPEEDMNSIIATTSPTSTLYPTTTNQQDDSIPPYPLQRGNSIPLTSGVYDSQQDPYLKTISGMNRSQTIAATTSIPSQNKSLYSQSMSTSLSSSMSSYSGGSPRKPKTNITKTNSSFVQRIITNDQLAKILVARTSEDTNLFYNCGSNFVWMDASCQPMEPLSRVVFARAYPTSHDVNLLTRGSDHLDIIIGFTSGDIVWFDPLCNKYGRINKGGLMNSSSITMIRWLQGSENLLMAAFQDGSIMIFDKEKEDDAFRPDNDNDDDEDNDDDFDSGVDDELSSQTSPKSTDSHWHFHHKYSTATRTSNRIPSTKSNSRSRTPKQTFRVSKSSSKLAAKCNPVSHWKLSNQSITAFAFSPDCQHVAVVGLDGYLRIINYVNEKLYDVYESYYGGLLCVTWSPDGKYILAGGQDDLVTIWAFREQRIIARCQGHSSWVTSVAFDSWRCDERVYRFASVGEDAKLILWDFSVPALHRPKAKVNTRHRGASVSSTTNPNLIQSSPNRPTTVHAVASKTEVAFLQPTVVKTIHADPCVGVYYREDAIVTTDKRGRVCVWKRP